VATQENLDKTYIDFSKRILVTRFGGLGDLLYMEPTIRAIYKKYFPCEIVVRTFYDYVGVFDNHPCISTMIYDDNSYSLGYNNNLNPKALNDWGDVDPNFDLCFDFSDAVESYIDDPNVHAVSAFAIKAGNLEVKELLPQIPYTAEHTPRHPLVVQLTSSGKERDLGQNEEVKGLLAPYNPYYIGEGFPATKLPYNQLVNIIRNCEVFVGTESCGVIMAAGLHKKTIGLYLNSIRIRTRGFSNVVGISFEEVSTKLNTELTKLLGQPVL